MIATKLDGLPAIPTTEDLWDNLGGLWQQLIPLRIGDVSNRFSELRPFLSAGHLRRLLQQGEHPHLTNPRSEVTRRYVWEMGWVRFWDGGITAPQESVYPGAWATFDGVSAAPDVADRPYITLQLYDYNTLEQRVGRCEVYAAPTVYDSSDGRYYCEEKPLLQATPGSLEDEVALNALVTVMRVSLPPPRHRAEAA